VADSPSIDDELGSESTRAGAMPLTSRLTSETTSATADEGQSVSSASSMQPLVSTTSRASNIHSDQTTASSLAPWDSVVKGCTKVTVTTAPSVVTAPLCQGVVVPQPVVVPPRNADTSSTMSLPRSEARLVPLSSLMGRDGSVASNRQSASPEIDVLPAVKRFKPVSDQDSATSVAGFVHKLQCVSNDDGDANTVEPGVDRSASTYRCGSPGLDEDGEFSHHKPKPAPGLVILSQSNTSDSVKLIPLSQVMSASTSSDAAAEQLSVKISRVDKISTKAKDNNIFSSEVSSGLLQTSKKQTESVQTKPKAARRRSTLLHAPDGTLSHAKQHAVNGTKSVKFDVCFTEAQPTDKENVCMQTTTVQQAGLTSQQTSQHDSNEVVSRTSFKSRSSSCNSSLSGEESDISSAKVRRSFVRPNDADDSTQLQRLPRAWERRSDNSSATSRRMSDRIKQKETDAQPNECEKSPVLATGRKRSASSGSSGPSSSEKKPAKKLTKIRTIAMTSLHS